MEGLPRLDPEAGETIEYLMIDQGKLVPSILELGNMKRPFEGLNLCIENLISYWGLDPELQKRRVLLPKWTNQEKISRKIVSKYPSAAIRGGNMADFHVRVLVDELGGPSSCAIGNINVAENFYHMDEICDLIEKEAKFDPAVIEDGTAIPSYFTTTIIYRLN